MRKSPKYGNKKITVGGVTFDSKKEYDRWRELSLLERAGKVTDLQRQVKFVLIPAQYEPPTTTKTGKLKRGKLIEREVSYIADFTYIQNDKIVVEDVKGYKKGQAYALFSIKRKLMRYVHSISVKEV